MGIYCLLALQSNIAEVVDNWIHSAYPVSTRRWHNAGSVPGLGGLKETKMFLPHPRVKVSIVGSLRDREVACSASDRQGSNFESCVWRTVSSQSSHHPQNAETLIEIPEICVLEMQDNQTAKEYGTNNTRQKAWLPNCTSVVLGPWYVFLGKPCSSTACTSATRSVWLSDYNSAPACLEGSPIHAFALMYVCMINQSLENCVIIAQLVLSISLRSRC